MTAARTSPGLRALAQLLAALLLGGPLGGAPPARDISQYVHSIWKLEQGLPAPAVRALAQTSDGFLWAGTDDGVVRFDGQVFKVYNRASHSGWTSQHVLALAAGQGAYLWIGTEDGLIRFDGQAFTRLGEAEGLPGAEILSLLGGEDGTLWVGTQQGLAKVQQGKAQAYPMPSGMAQKVRALAMDGAGRLWIGSNAGLFLLDGGRVKHVQLPGLPAGPSVKALHWSRRGGVLWLGTTNGLFRLADGLAHRVPIQKAQQVDHVLSLAEDSAGRIWIGTLYGGLARWDPSGPGGPAQLFTVKDGLSNDVVNGILADREENIWVATTFGLNRFRIGKMLTWSARQGLSGNKAFVVLEDRLRGLFVGTSSGLSQWRDGRFQAVPLPGRIMENARRTRRRLENLHVADGGPFQPQSITSLHQSKDGALWIGTRFGGLARMDARGTKVYGREDGIENNEISFIFEDRQGDLWVGTRSGLSRFRRGILSPSARWDALKGRITVCMHQDREGTLWVGTSRGGLFTVRNERVDSFPGPPGLSRALVLCLAEDEEGALWAGTYGGGVYQIKGGRATPLSTQHGLPDEVVYQILDDGLGRFWMSSNKGVFAVAKEEIRACAEGRLPRVNPEAYGREDGMKNAECNGKSQPAGTRTQDGRLWFPTLEGVVEVDPGRLAPNPCLPTLHLDEVEVDGKPFPRLDGSRLGPGTRDITFRYIGLSYAMPGRLRYRYRLGGYNQDWVQAGASRTAAYTNLPPGRYRFEAMASNEDGAWGPAGAICQFEIATSLWGRAWARVAAMLGGALLLNLAYRGIRRLIEAVLYWRRTHFLGPYHLLSYLGEGGVGEVYRARDRRNGSLVALKVISPEVMDDQVQERFEREWEICRQLDHPNIIRIFDHGLARGRFYLAMELCHGPTLRELIKEGATSCERAFSLAKTLFSIMGDIHAMGVIHRDIKPENIIFREHVAASPRLENLDSQIVFLDFGLARLVDSATRTRTGLVTGTVDYLSPEYLRGQGPADARLDVYALGIIFYELLTGSTPYTAAGEDMMQRVYAIAYTDPAPPDSLVPGLSGPVSAFVLSLIARDADQRLTDIPEILRRIESLRPS